MVIVILEGTCGVDWSNGGQGLTRSCREITLAASKLSPLGQVPSRQEKTRRSSCCLKAKKGFPVRKQASHFKKKIGCRKQNKGKCELGQLREGRKLRGIYSFLGGGRAGVEDVAGQQRQAVSDSRRGKGQQLLRRVRAAWTAQIWRRDDRGLQTMPSQSRRRPGWDVRQKTQETFLWNESEMRRALSAESL